MVTIPVAEFAGARAGDAGTAVLGAPRRAANLAATDRKQFMTKPQLMEFGQNARSSRTVGRVV
jgi:hypothetical protein